MASESGGWIGELGKGAAGAIGGVLGTAFAGVALLWFKGWLSPLWSWVQNASGSLWTHLMAQSSWPNWLAYVISVAALFICLRWALRQWRNRKDSTRRFHQLSFWGVVWRWKPTSGLPDVLEAFCPSCDTRLVYENVIPNQYTGRAIGVKLHCETCSKQALHYDGGFLDHLNERVIREIERLHRTGEWKAHVSK